MKFLRYIFLLFTLSGMVACQEDYFPNELPSQPETEISGYMMASMHMARLENSATRANMTFTSDNIEEFENGINSLGILLFQSETKITSQEQENNAVYIGKAMYSNELGPSSDDNISRKSNYLLKVDDVLKTTLADFNFSDNYYYYGLAIANSTDILDTYLNVSDKFEKLREMERNGIMDMWRYGNSSGRYRMLMTNASYWPEGSHYPYSDPLILTPIDVNKIKWVKEEEIEKINAIEPVAEFFLERNCAKITVNYNNEYTIEEGPNAGMKIQLSESYLDVVSKRSYLLQNTTGLGSVVNNIYEMDNNADTRFHKKIVNSFDWVTWGIDTDYTLTDNIANVATDYEGFYKMYNGTGWFANDNNYTKSSSYQGDHYTDPAFQKFYNNNTGYFDASTTTFYLNENTGDIESMKRSYTTHLVIDTEFFGSDGSRPGFFFTIPGKEEDGIPIVYYASKIKQLLKEVYPDIDYIYISPYTNSSLPIKHYIRYILNSIELRNSAGKQLTTTLAGEDYISTDRMAEILGFDINSDAYVFTNNSKIFIPIRHFMDSEMNYLSPNYDEEGQVYYDIRHLGRWGVVRNHAYEIIIDGFTSLDPEYLDVPEDTWDDKSKDYTNLYPSIKYTIKVVDWENVDQHVDL